MLSFPVEPILTAECNYAGSAALAWSDVSPAKRFAQLIEESRCMSGNQPTASICFLDARSCKLALASVIDKSNGCSPWLQTVFSIPASRADFWRRVTDCLCVCTVYFNV